MECSEDVNIIDYKWVFKTNRNNASNIDKYKARQVAKGYSQVQGVNYDEMYAPVVQLAFLQMILAIAAWND